MWEELPDGTVRMNGIKSLRMDDSLYHIKGFNPSEHRRVALVAAKLERIYGRCGNHPSDRIRAGAVEARAKSNSTL